MHATTGGFIGLGDDKTHIVVSVQSQKARHRERG
jgi:hypothetical protein